MVGSAADVDSRTGRLDDLVGRSTRRCRFAVVLPRDHVRGGADADLIKSFWSLTTHEGEITRLWGEIAPSASGFVIARDYASEDLPLWRMTVRPTELDDETQPSWPLA